MLHEDCRHINPKLRALELMLALLEVLAGTCHKNNSDCGVHFYDQFSRVPRGLTAAKG